MTIKKSFLITAQSGEFDSRVEWPVLVTEDEEKAQSICADLNRISNGLEVQGVSETDAEEYIRNGIDVNCSIIMGVFPEYWVVKVPFMNA